MNVVWAELRVGPSASLQSLFDNGFKLTICFFSVSEMHTDWHIVGGFCAATANTKIGLVFTTPGSIPSSSRCWCGASRQERLEQGFLIYVLGDDGGCLKKHYVHYHTWYLYEELKYLFRAPLLPFHQPSDLLFDF